MYAVSGGVRELPALLSCHVN